jgi:type I restriction enzyme S subunit
LDDGKKLHIPKLGDEIQLKIDEIFRLADKVRDNSRIGVQNAEQALLSALGLANWAPPEPLAYSAKSAVVFAAGRLDAQYFMPAKRVVYDALASMPGETLGSRFISVRDMFNPMDAQPDLLVRNYDVTDALQPVLNNENEPVAVETLGSLKKSLREGDVAISRLRAYLREIAVVRASGEVPAVGSSEYIVLRPRDPGTNDIAPETLLTYLRSAPVQTILKWCQDGSQHPRFSESDLLSIPVPDSVGDASSLIETIVKGAFACREDARALLNHARRAVEIAIEESEVAALAYLDEATGA